MLMTKYQSHNRRGFTLVELLTAAALTLFIMAIMATAFQVGLDSLSHLKGAATLSDQLRTVKGIMQRDLEATHLEDEYGTPKLISELNGDSWSDTAKKGRKGYFLVRQPTSASSVPGSSYFIEQTTATDVDGVGSWRATDHVLSMTVKLKGGKPEEMFTAVDSTAKGYTSVWGEITYFLRPTTLESSNDNGLPSVPLYTLHRSQRLLSTDATPYTGAAGDAPGLSVNGSNISTPSDVIDPAKRFGGTGTLIVDPSGSDILLSNVVSFQVRLMVKTNDLTKVGDYEYKDLPSAGSFDTANPTDKYPDVPKDPMDPSKGKFNQNVIGIQIKVRVYDTRQRMTRQITIEQKL